MNVTEFVVGSLCVLAAQISEIVEINSEIYEIYEVLFQDNYHDQKVLLLPIYVLGLANRLRSISSAYVLAKGLNRKLVVLWYPSSECNSSSTDLFSVEPNDAVNVIDCQHNSLDIIYIESAFLLKKSIFLSMDGDIICLIASIA